MRNYILTTEKGRETVMHKTTGEAKGEKECKWSLLNCLAVILIVFMLIPAVTEANEKLRNVPEAREFKTYSEITNKLPLPEALGVLMKAARSGDCHAAGYLAYFLRSKSIQDIDGHDDRYWLLFAAKCGHIPSMIKLGYPQRYSTTTIVTCGENKLEIVTECDPLTREKGISVCPKQVLSFFDMTDRLSKKQIAINKPINREYSVLAWAAVCASNQMGWYYVIRSTDFGGSCCEWEDVFDKAGRYMGSTNKRTSFQVEIKTLPKRLEEAIFRNFEDWDAIETQINSYPKF